jgi:hypothetical protein
MAAFGKAFQPGQSLDLSVSHGSASDVTRGSLKGRGEVLYYDFQYKYASSLGEGLLLSTGVAFDRTDF